MNIIQSIRIRPLAIATLLGLCATIPAVLVAGSTHALAETGPSSATHLPTAPQASRARNDLNAAAPLVVTLPGDSAPANAATARHDGTAHDWARDWARAPERALSPFGLPCEDALGVSIAPGGVIQMVLSSPCRASQPVRLEHAGMVLDLHTDQIGTLRLDLPALVEAGDIALVFADDTSLTRSVTVPDLASFRRVAIVWKGASGLALHAREVARPATKTLNIWHQNPRALRVALRGQGGSLTVLGTGTARAEIYTMPRDLGTVRLSLEGSVNADNCDSAILATSFRTMSGQDPDRTDLRLRLPGCDRVGEYLRLKNVLPDLKIARN